MIYNRTRNERRKNVVASLPTWLDYGRENVEVKERGAQPRLQATRLRRGVTGAKNPKWL